MKITNKKWHPALLIMYLVLFTTASGNFNGIACQLVDKTASNCQEEIIRKTQKKTILPVMNPLQMLTSKFM